MDESTELVTIRHPRTKEQYKVLLVDLDDDLPASDNIPLYDLNGKRRSQLDALLGSGRPSSIPRREAITAYRATLH